jgi:AraC family transcriptional regulator, transcriptional activator of pobA
MTAIRRSTTREAERVLFGHAAEIIAADFATPLTIEDVARRLALSPRQLQRVFANVEGVGFREYLCELRMAHAAALLAATDLPITEIARRVGYRNASQFSKAFKRVHGVKPSDARPAGGREAVALPPDRARDRPRFGDTDQDRREWTT